MKKTISLLLIAMLLVSVMVPTAFAAEHTGTVTVTYTASGDAFAGFLGDLTYNHDLFTLVSVTGVNCSSAENNGDRVIWERGTNQEAPATVLTVVFSLKAGISCGTYTGFGFSMMDAIDENREGVSLSISGNSVVLNHNWVKGTEVDATCTSNGYIPYTCDICGETKQEITAQGGHKAAAAVKENVVAATCTTAGSYDEVVYCSVCGEEISRTTKTEAALGHTPAAAVKENVVAATCTTDGSYDEVVYCSVCGEEISRTTKTETKLGHKPAAAVKENVVAATCTAAGSYDEVVYCSVCGEELSRTTKTEAKLDHTPAAAVKENVVAATCGEDGSHEDVVYCSVCGEELSRQRVTDPATGEHKYDKVTINTDKGTHTVSCSVCGQNDPANTDKAHTDKNSDGKCDVCGATVKTGSDDNDDEGENDTGDITPYPVFFLMAVMAVMGTAYGFKRFTK